MRTFAAVADAGQFQDAAADLSITQQAVSKRIARLERHLGVRLFTRTARGARLTADGQAFLPHARDLLQAEARAAASVRPGRRALRVDVIGRQLAPAGLLRGFHRAHPDTELDVVTLFDAGAAIRAVQSAEIDASFRALTMPARELPAGVEAVRVLDEPVQLLTGPAHELAGARAVTPAQLAGLRIWMPGVVPGTEWAAFYGDLAAAFGFTIDTGDPSFGTEPLLDVIAGSPSWPPSSVSRPGSPGPPATTCGASPCAIRHRSTRTHCSGAATTGTPRSVRSAATWAPASVVSAAPGRGRRPGRGPSLPAGG